MPVFANEQLQCLPEHSTNCLSLLTTPFGLVSLSSCLMSRPFNQPRALPQLNLFRTAHLLTCCGNQSTVARLASHTEDNRSQTEVIQLLGVVRQPREPDWAGTAVGASATQSPAAPPA